jgi:predicted ABC-type ATPase
MNLTMTRLLKRFFIIAGANGAGKTTASYTILPEMLNCKEFVNADELARGISPFNPESASIQAGKLMLERIGNLMTKGKDFAIETTLSTRSYKNLVKQAKENGYSVTLLYFWLRTPDLAIKRVEIRVKEGGHNIDEAIIRRRYKNGLTNFFRIFESIVDEWIFIDNSGDPFQIIAQRNGKEKIVNNAKVWKELLNTYNQESYE